MTNDKPKFEFNKVDEEHYQFVMDSADIRRVETVSKQFAKDHYKEIKAQKLDIMKNLGAAIKAIERAQVVKDDELDHFLELANKAADYKKGVEARAQRDAMTDMLEKINQSIESMEKTLPELKRMSDQ